MFYSVLPNLPIATAHTVAEFGSAGMSSKSAPSTSQVPPSTKSQSLHSFRNPDVNPSQRSLRPPSVEDKDGESNQSIRGRRPGSISGSESTTGSVTPSHPSQDYTPESVRNPKTIQIPFLSDAINKRKAKKAAKEAAKEAFRQAAKEAARVREAAKEAAKDSEDVEEINKEIVNSRVILAQELESDIKEESSFWTKVNITLIL